MRQEPLDSCWRRRQTAEREEADSRERKRQPGERGGGRQLLEDYAARRERRRQTGERGGGRQQREEEADSRGGSWQLKLRASAEVAKER